MLQAPWALSLFLSAAAVSSSALASSGAPLEITGTRVSAAWIEATPLLNDSPAVLVQVDPGQTRVDLPAAVEPQAMVCLGGDGLGVRCQLAWLDGKVVRVLAEGGVAVVGSCRIGERPCGGAKVAVVPAGLVARRPFTVPLLLRADELVREVSCDAGGRFRLPPLAPGEYQLQLHPMGGRLALGEVFSVPAVLPEGQTALELGEVQLADGARVEVRVIDAAGSPVAGAGVGARQGEEIEELVFFETAADAEGRAQLAGLEPAAATVVTCVAAGYRRLEQSFDVPPPWVECALEALAEVRGTVQDPDGVAIAGAAVSAGRRVLATSGEDGSFHLAGLVAGSWELVIAAPGWRAEQLQLELVPGETRQLPILELLPGAPIEGVVLDDAAQPVAGAQLAALAPAGAVDAVSEEDGRFHFDVNPEVPLRLEVRAAGYPPVERQLAPEELQSGEPVEIRLTAGGRIRVTVWDEASGEPCVGCTVSVFGPTPNLPRLHTGEDGRALSPPLAAGSYQVQRVEERSLGTVVTVRGGHDLQLADVRPGQVQEVVFGAPRALLRLRLDPGLPAGWSLSAVSGSSILGLTPAADGSFQVPRLEATATILQLHDPTGGHVVLAELGADFTGEELALAVPDTGVRGFLHTPEGQPLARDLAVLSVADGSRQATTHSRADGSFELRFLPPGTYALTSGTTALRMLALTTGRDQDLGVVELAP